MNSEKQSTNLQMTLREVNSVGEGQKNVPKLRFKGYEDAWEQRRLADVSVLNPKGEIPTTFKYVDLESVLGTSLLGYKIESKESAPSRAQRVAKKGDIFYQTVRPYQKNNYYFCLEEEDYVFSTGYAQIRPNCSGLFLFTYLQLDGFVLTVLNNCTGTSYPAINSKVLSDLNIRIPQILEQEKIGDIFHSLENLITLHQRKYDALKSMKKTLLSKMFPKNGEDVPEIRFKEYTDAWEQRRLEEIFLKIRNAFVGTSTPYYVEKNQGGYFYIESNNVKHGKINHDTEVFINEEFYQNQKDKWLKTGDIVMVQSGHVGHSAVIPEYLNNSAAHALIMFQEYKIETNPYFINFQFQTESVRNKIDSITTGNTIKHILASDMKLFSISSTQKKEADKLGDFFISLDNLITLHQRKLEELKNMKKTLLQQMFV